MQVTLTSIPKWHSMAQPPHFRWCWCCWYRQGIQSRNKKEAASSRLAIADDHRLCFHFAKHMKIAFHHNWYSQGGSWSSSPPHYLHYQAIPWITVAHCRRSLSTAQFLPFDPPTHILVSTVSTMLISAWHPRLLPTKFTCPVLTLHIEYSYTLKVLFVLHDTIHLPMKYRSNYYNLWQSDIIWRHLNMYSTIHRETVLKTNLLLHNTTVNLLIGILQIMNQIRNALFYQCKYRHHHHIFNHFIHLTPKHNHSKWFHIIQTATHFNLLATWP